MVLPTPEQRANLTAIERVASCFSLVGTAFIFITFISSREFRRPINRLVFYASWGNTLCSVAALISESGGNGGPHSPLCQFQAFFIQMFIPADAYWNLAMAFNVYLTLFRKYNAQQLKALEWRYHALCYGTPFVVAMVLLFIETEGRGRIYGQATLWCWIAEPWAYLRIVTCYAPAWVCIIISMTIYFVSGVKIYKDRKELRGFRNTFDTFDSGCPDDNDLQDHATALGSEASTPGLKKISHVEELPATLVNSPTSLSDSMNNSMKKGSQAYTQYTMHMAALQPEGHIRGSVRARPTSLSALRRFSSNRLKSGLDSSKAARGYTKVAFLFFVSLLVTWVPSSANRLWALIYPNTPNLPLAYIAATVLSLMGFWNSLIYIFTSRAACKALFTRIFNGDDNDDDPHSKPGQCRRLSMRFRSINWIRRASRKDRAGRKADNKDNNDEDDGRDAGEHDYEKYGGGCPGDEEGYAAGRHTSSHWTIDPKDAVTATVRAASVSTENSSRPPPLPLVSSNFNPSSHHSTATAKRDSTSSISSSCSSSSSTQPSQSQANQHRRTSLYAPPMVADLSRRDSMQPPLSPLTQLHHLSPPSPQLGQRKVSFSAGTPGALLQDPRNSRRTSIYSPREPRQGRRDSYDLSMHTS